MSPRSSSVAASSSAWLSRDALAGVDRDGPHRLGQYRDRVLDLVDDGEPDRESQVKPLLVAVRRRWASHSFVAPAPSQRTRIGWPCPFGFGVWLNASSVSRM